MIFVYVPKSEIRDLPLSENDRSDFYRTRTLAENDNGRGISIGACALGLISLLPLSLWFSLCLRKLSIILNSLLDIKKEIEATLPNVTVTVSTPIKRTDTSSAGKAID